MASTYTYQSDSGNSVTETLTAEQAAADVAVLHQFDSCETSIAEDGEKVPQEAVDAAIPLIRSLPPGRARYWQRCFARIGVALVLDEPKPVDPKTVTTKKSQQGGIK